MPDIFYPLPTYIAMAISKQFDLHNIKVDAKLHGITLAPFGRRTFAYLLDWAIIIACTRYLWLAIIVVLVFVVSRKKYRKTLFKSSVLVRFGLRKLDHQFENYNVEQSLRSQFKRHLTIYMLVLIYAPLVVSAVVLIGIILGVLSPNEYGTITEKFHVQGAMFFHPFKDAYNIMSFVGGLIGGLFYFSLFTWKWQGQTPGKRLMKIKVVKLDGTPITLWNSFERFSGYSSSASLLLLGFLQYYWDKSHQTTHDKITETIVVQK